MSSPHALMEPVRWLSSFEGTVGGVEVGEHLLWLDATDAPSCMNMASTSVQASPTVFWSGRAELLGAARCWLLLSNNNMMEA